MREGSMNLHSHLGWPSWRFLGVFPQYLSWLVAWCAHPYIFRLRLQVSVLILDFSSPARIGLGGRVRLRVPALESNPSPNQLVHHILTHIPILTIPPSHTITHTWTHTHTHTSMCMQWNFFDSKSRNETLPSREAAKRNWALQDSWAAGSDPARHFS